MVRQKTKKKSYAGGVAARRRRKLLRKEAFNEILEQDETFAYIAGYTEAGFAYGVTWEEWERLDYENSNHPDLEIGMTTDAQSQDIPF